MDENMQTRDLMRGMLLLLNMLVKRIVEYTDMSVEAYGSTVHSRLRALCSSDYPTCPDRGRQS